MRLWASFKVRRSVACRRSYRWYGGGGHFVRPPIQVTFLDTITVCKLWHYLARHEPKRDTGTLFLLPTIFRMSHPSPFPSSSPDFDFFAGEVGFEANAGASVLNGMDSENGATSATDTDGDEWSAAQARAVNELEYVAATAACTLISMESTFRSTYPISQIHEPIFRGMCGFHPSFLGDGGMPSGPSTSSDSVMADSIANLNLSGASATLNGGGHAYASGAMAPSNSPTFRTLELGDGDANARAIQAIDHAHRTARHIRQRAMPRMPVDFTTMEPSSGRTRKPRTVRRGPATGPRNRNRHRGRAATLPANELNQLVAAADALNV
ncbi:hypothetical protein DFH06DRAFT_1371932 [Mycena polygramma]|nr:hypothetical protein DFH06DRAFT_1371932 [Mycena polygramma]